MDQRVQFIAALDAAPEEPFSAVCARFGISRKTGYKWLARYHAARAEGLCDVSTRPLQPARATPPPIVAAILAERKAHPSWGPKKIRAVLHRQQPDTRWPAVSTVGAVLKRCGLVVPRRVRLRWRTPRAARPLPTEPNGTWCVDFKGDFALGNGTRCYPLTVTDLYSRYLLTITCYAQIDTEAVLREFDRLFRLYGVPARIRSDNGVPFATKAPGGLSRLALRWIKLGIVPERTEPGHPEQNGAHERMHATLKAEVTRPPQPTLAAQQVASDQFRHTFNTERPHEALGQTPPTMHYRVSPRLPPEVLPDPTYGSGFQTLRVQASGRVVWKGHRVQIHRMLAGELLGLESLGGEQWAVFFGPIRLGMIDLTRHRPHLQPIDGAPRDEGAGDGADAPLGTLRVPRGASAPSKQTP